MSYIQISAIGPHINVNIKSKSYHSLFIPHTSLTCATRRLPRISLRPASNASGYHQRRPVCLFGGKGKSENEPSTWKSLEKALGSFKKEESVESLLRKQIEKGEYVADGGSGGIPPRGGGGGGDNSGGVEDEGFAGIADEFVQVILATLGFIFLYIYIITGEELLRLAKDYIKYLFGGNQSVRLRRTMYQWGRWYQRINAKKVVDKNWLEREILNTTTWWDGPEKYRHIARSYMAPAQREETVDESEDENDE